MDKIKYLSRYQLLINKYEKLLSPFGQKVMLSLINIKNGKYFLLQNNVIVSN